MCQRQMSALAEQDVPSQLLRHLFIELHRCVIEGDAFRSAIVGAQDSRVATAVAAAEIAFVEQGDFLHSMTLAKVVSSGKPVNPSADDDDIVGRLELARPPHSLCQASSLLDASKPNTVMWNSSPASRRDRKSVV